MIISGCKSAFPFRKSCKTLASAEACLLLLTCTMLVLTLFKILGRSIWKLCWLHVDLAESVSEASPASSPLHLVDHELNTFILSFACILGQHLPDSGVSGNISILLFTPKIYRVSCVQSLFYITDFPTPRRDNMYFLNRTHKSWIHSGWVGILEVSAPTHDQRTVA